MIWLSNNVGVLVSLSVLFVAMVGAWYSNKARIDRLEEESGRHQTERTALIQQNQKDKEKLDSKIEELERVVQSHTSDTRLHIDPSRDEKRWDDLKGEIFRRFDKMEGKIEKLMIIYPAAP